MNISYHGITAIHKDFIDLINDKSFREVCPDAFDGIAEDLLADLGGMMGEW